MESSNNLPIPGQEKIVSVTVENAIDFGDLTALKRNTAGCSDSHGGLGGF